MLVEDPCRVIPNDEQMSSVLKFAIDLYSLEATAQLIYTNDVKVLIDITIRQLTDLSDTDKVSFPSALSAQTTTWAELDNGCL